MRQVKLSLDEQTIEIGKALIERYGKAASLSAIVRRAVSLLDEEWERIDGAPRATLAEKGTMCAFLSESKRGNPLL